MKLRYYYIIILLSTSACSNDSVSDKYIIGEWCAGSGNAFHEVFSIAKEDDEQTFSSWFHQRPAISGKWKLNQQNLIIDNGNGNGNGNGLKFDYLVVMANSNKLILREKNQKPETYIHCN